MRRKTWIVVVVLGLAAVGWASIPRRAEGFPAFKKEFDHKYLQKDTPLYKAYGGKSTCNVCHIGGTMDRQHRNAYGRALDGLLDKTDADALSFATRMRDPQAVQAAEEKVRRALQQVETLPSSEKKDNSPTFGDLIRAGLLPVSPNILPD